MDPLDTTSPGYCTVDFGGGNGVWKYNLTSDLNGNPVTYTLVSGPTASFTVPTINGWVVKAGPGACVYTPPLGTNLQTPIGDNNQNKDLSHLILCLTPGPPIEPGPSADPHIQVCGGAPTGWAGGCLAALLVGWNITRAASVQISQVSITALP